MTPTVTAGLDGQKVRRKTTRGAGAVIEPHAARPLPVLPTAAALRTNRLGPGFGFRDDFAMGPMLSSTRRFFCFRMLLRARDALQVILTLSSGASALVATVQPIDWLLEEPNLLVAMETHRSHDDFPSWRRRGGFSQLDPSPSISRRAQNLTKIALSLQNYTVACAGTGGAGVEDVEDVERAKLPGRFARTPTLPQNVRERAAQRKIAD